MEIIRPIDSGGWRGEAVNQKILYFKVLLLGSECHSLTECSIKLNQLEA